jgi:hypothetical protein
LAFELLHHLADERAGGLNLAVANLLGHIGIGRDHRVDGGFQRAGVLHQLQAARIGDRRRSALAGEHAIPDLTGHRVVEAAAGDQALQLGDVGRPDTQGLGIGHDIAAVGVGAARDLAGPPLAGSGRLAPAATVLLDEIDQAGVDDIAHL